MSQAVSPARTPRETSVRIKIAPVDGQPRAYVRGKFIFIDDEKFYIRGVTYGTFRPGEDGDGYPDPDVVEQDFIQMADSGINAIRTYTVPPGWLLDAALRHDLRVMVGLPWEQHIAFLDQKGTAQSIETRVRDGVRACSRHPAVLCYAVGNEISASIVRWHGRRRVERYIGRLYRAVKAEDPEGIVTYVNFPSTEYLQLPFLDLICFNVYLEGQQPLENYLARLQNIAGDRPLVLTEIGLDSRRNGCQAQAHTLDWQLRTAFATGCAGAFVFAWTDEWYRGGYGIEDWDFGLTDRERNPKPALARVRRAFAELPFPEDLSWPRVSVIVCSYNGARVIRDCLEALLQLEYSNYEVIVVDDGSTDQTACIAREYGFRVISTENCGLSSARNTGLKAATGEIVAYIDDDAYPDPHWLTYLATTFLNSTYAGVGGPNVAPPGDGLIADCVANAPGGPVHVLTSDREAEHIPGCNMAFRRTCLEEIGGFDARFRVAGDDVDVCWRLHQRGWTLGFNPAALVWHHRRNSVKAYWKQQKGYGKAEALLEKKWPEKYNSLGHLNWGGGRVYGKGLTQTLGWRRTRIYQGVWGSAPFQSIYPPAPGFFGSLPSTPEWYLIVMILAALSTLGIFWRPMLLSLPLLAVVVGLPLTQAVISAAHACFTSKPATRISWLKLYSVTAFLHLLQPLGRLSGRMRHGLYPWRFASREISLPWPQTLTIWSEEWKAADVRLRRIEKTLRALEANVARSGDYDRWDIVVRGGLLGSSRLRMAIEEHGGGKQLVRMRLWPRCSPASIILVLVFALLMALSAADAAWVATVVFGAIALLIATRNFLECGAAIGAIRKALRVTEAGLHD